MGALCRSPTILRSTLPDEPPLDGKGLGDPIKGGALCADRGPKAALMGREVLPAHGGVTPGQVDDAEAVIPFEMKLRRERRDVAVMRGNGSHRKAQSKAQSVQERSDLTWLRTAWAEGFQCMDGGAWGSRCGHGVSFLLLCGC
jgi:hypothetical protein